MSSILHYTKVVLLLSCIFAARNISAQETKFLSDKPGKFIFHTNLESCPALMDKTMLAKNMTTVAEWFHQNNILFNPVKGFDMSVLLYENTCWPVVKLTNNDYGITCSINFSFRYFYIENGITHTANGEMSGYAEMLINNPFSKLGNSLGDRGFESGDDPAYEKRLNAAHENLYQYYTAAMPEKEIAPGVTLYKGGHLVISNPNRPEFWLPVTVNEVMEAMLNYWKIRKEVDAISYAKKIAEAAKLGMKIDPVDKQATVYDLIAKEYSAFTPDELKSWAHTSTDPISGISAHMDGNKIMKFNPECWDRSLPKEAVQFISIEYKPRSKAEMNEYSHENDQLTDYVGMFINAIPAEKLGELIKHK